MKKSLLLIALGAFAAMPLVAQDEDMTQYIQNAGFDEDLTWNADGSKKGEMVRQTSLSNRSYAYVTEDGSLYAAVASTTDKSRSDGRTFEATNGFVGQIKGWQWASERTNDACEWVYFGTLPYDLQEQAIPIADDGNTYMIVPERPTEFDGGTGALYLRAGWGGSFSYKQEVKLPCAEYRLEYWTINVNPNTTATATDLSKITCRRDVFQEDGGTALTAAEWTKHEFEFTPVDKFTIEFGFKAGNGGSGTTPWVFVDGIKLYKIGEADPIDLVRDDLYYYEDLLNSLEDSLVGVDKAPFYGLIDEVISTKENLMDESYKVDNDLEKLQAIVNQMKELFENSLGLTDVARRVEALLLKAENLTSTTNYPGKAELEAYCEQVDELLFSKGTAAEVAAAEEELKKAINEYYFSQEATMDAPANFSFLVPSPWFCVDGREPASGAAADVSAAALTSADSFADESWVNGSTATNRTTGMYFKVGRTCYQLWADNNFTGYLDAHNDLSGLPNGIYSLSMDLITNTDALSDQHIYLSSSLGDSEGQMTEDGVLWEWASGDYTGGYPDDGSEPWETVTTESTVIVNDGKLTIGARSTHGDPDVEDISTSYRRGSFWFTNVVLYYHGPATEEQIAAAVAAREQKANDLAAAMHFAADKKQVNDSIAAYNQGKELDLLNNAIALAEKSEAKYDEINEAGKTLPTVAANLADEELAAENYGSYIDLVKYANDATLAWISGDAASYTEVDSILNVMKAYVNTYREAALNADELAYGWRSATAKEALAKVLEEQKAKLMPGNNVLLTVSAVEKLVSQLNHVMDVAEAQDLYERNQNATDYTEWIINPDFAANDGWEYIVTKGDGPVKSGQYFDGNADHKYFDSYTSTRGELNVTGLQVVEGLPNGTYEAKACVRTPGEGAFIFAATGTDKADSIFVEIPLHSYSYTYFDDESNERDTTVIASDKFGPIWEEARHQVLDEGNNDPDVLAIYEANGAQGRGWKWLTIENIVVKDHTLTIGQTTDPALTGKNFDGTWFSVTDWSLTLTEKGDNEGWNGPLTGVESISVTAPAQADGIYSLDGRRVSRTARGLYIVVRGGKASKVLVK